MNSDQLYNSVAKALESLREAVKNETHMTSAVALEMHEADNLWISTNKTNPYTEKIKASGLKIDRGWTGMQQYDLAWSGNSLNGRKRPSSFLQVKLDKGPTQQSAGHNKPYQPTSRFTDFLHDLFLLGCDWELDQRQDTRAGLAFLTHEALVASYHWRKLWDSVVEKSGSQVWTIVIEPSGGMVKALRKGSYFPAPEHIIQPETFSQLRAITGHSCLRNDIGFYNRPGRLEIDFRFRRGKAACYCFLLADVLDVRLSETSSSMDLRDWLP